MAETVSEREALFNELLTELTTEMSLAETTDIAIMRVKLKNAFREIESAFNFHDTHDEDFRIAEMKKHIGNIKDLAMYDFSIIGAEGGTQYSENGIQRSWKKRSMCFDGIVRFADI